MNRTRSMGFLILLLLVSFVSLNSQTLNEILKKNYEARGGYERLKATKSAKTYARLVMGSMELPMVITTKRPNTVRSEVIVQGQKIVSVFDGTSGWMINPMQGSTDPVDMPAEEMKNVKEQADMDGFLVDWKEKGSTLELVGKEDVEGADAYHIKVTTKDGDVRHVYVDADSYLEIQQKGKYPAQGKELEITTSLGSYKMVDSMMIPFSVEGKYEGKTVQQMVIDSVFFNVPVPDSLLVRPKSTK